MARVLIAEDDAGMHELYLSCAREAGLPVTDFEMVVTAEELISRAQRAPYELIITDNCLLGPMTGVVAVHLIRKLDNHHGTPLYMISTCRDYDAVKALGATGFISKCENNLIDRILEILQKHVPPVASRNTEPGE